MKKDEVTVDALARAVAKYMWVSEEESDEDRPIESFDRWTPPEGPTMSSIDEIGIDEHTAKKLGYYAVVVATEGGWSGDGENISVTVALMPSNVILKAEHFINPKKMVDTLTNHSYGIIKTRGTWDSYDGMSWYRSENDWHKVNPQVVEIVTYIDERK